MLVVHEQSYVRIRIVIRGAVQGVGFRPFVYRLAEEMKLAGWVMNSTLGVIIEAEGEEVNLKEFFRSVQSKKPPRVVIQSIEHWFLDPIGFSRFEIRESDDNGPRTALILPDIATCPDCLNEIFDRGDRHYLYPFTNCTNCGPRFSIIESLPYDRANTAMHIFMMCHDCQKEYINPHDRRYHAQPNACPRCGPQLQLWDDKGGVLHTKHEALLAVATSLRAGNIVAVKGLGGFHLLADARNNASVNRLRVRKHREEKPFAVMFPTIQIAKKCCDISPLEEQLILSPESPIVLVHRKENNQSVAASVAPSNPYLGIMLPYTPLHHILMRELGFPVVATSGNRSDEPICTDEHEALDRLHGIADLFLVHNRPIRRHVDDSIARVILGREQILRRARGYAPLPFLTNDRENRHRPMIAVGAHLKSAIAFSIDSNIFISQHIGDLESGEAFHAFTNVIADFKQLYQVQPEKILCDMHPDYISTGHAYAQHSPVEEIQHHYAHVASCMAENQLEGRVLGVSWDGTGYGLDGTIWGGEFLLTNETSFDRAASFKPFLLPGGERAIREARRSAIGVLYEVFGEELFFRNDLFPLQQFSSAELGVIRHMLTQHINAPSTSSVGRMFDAVASIINLRHQVSFEGQAAMEMEFLTGGETLPCTDSNTAYHFSISSEQPLLLIDWHEMIKEIVHDLNAGVDAKNISIRFHNTLCEMIIEIAKRTGEKKIVLSGGCFQNRFLLERTVQHLRAGGFHPYWHQRVPTNDGGIALGQIYASMRNRKMNHSVDVSLDSKPFEESEYVSGNPR